MFNYIKSLFGRKFNVKSNSLASLPIAKNPGINLDKFSWVCSESKYSKFGEDKDTKIILVLTYFGELKK